MEMDSMGMYLMMSLVCFMVFWPLVYRIAKERGKIPDDAAEVRYRVVYVLVLLSALLAALLWPIACIAVLVRALKKRLG